VSRGCLRVRQLDAVLQRGRGRGWVELTGDKTWWRGGGIRSTLRLNDGELWFTLVVIFQTGRRMTSGGDGHVVQWRSSSRLLWGWRRVDWWSFKVMFS
jgi:hypothetical protein